MTRASALALEVVLLVLAASTGTAATLGPGDTAWVVWIDGRTHGASGVVEAGGEIWLNAVALAPALGLEASLAGDLFRLHGDGRTWLGRPGGYELRSAAGSMPVRWAQTADGAWYLPAAVVAELAGRNLAVSREWGRIELSPAAAPESGAADAAHAVDPDGAQGEPAGTAEGSGWQSFTLAKTRDELREDDRREAVGPQPGALALPPELPPAHDRLAVRLGLSHVVGGDWGFETTATGAVGGVETALATLVTYGPDGADLYSGRLDLADPARGWGAEVGDLFSETWGFARGLRFSWRQRRHQPAVALYLPTSRSLYDEPLLAYRDEVALGERAVVGGEVVSDGAWFLRGRLRHRRLALYGYLRDTPVGGDGYGASFTWDLSRGMALQGSFNRLGDGATGSDWGTVSLRLPLAGWVDATLEAAEIHSPWGISRSQAVALARSAGPLRLRARYQERQVEVDSAFGSSVTNRYRELQGAVGYGDRRLRFELQGAGLWFEDGAPIFHGQVVGSYQLGRATSFQVLGTFADRAELGRYRIRLAQLLPGGFEVAAEYGDVPPLQGSREYDSTWLEEEHLKLVVRRSFDVATPGSGARVDGRALGISGERLAGVAVRLGPYRTYTDLSGRYVFTNVPEGTYELSVEAESSPAHLAAVGPPATVELGRASRVSSDLFLAPLGSVSGHVYLDRDRDGRRGAGEGVAGAVVVLGEDATATATDGSFSFHNLPAANHRLRLVTERLPRGIRAGGPMVLDVGLPPGGSSTSLELRLVEARRPVVFQEVPP